MTHSSDLTNETTSLWNKGASHAMIWFFTLNLPRNNKSVYKERAKLAKDWPQLESKKVAMSIYLIVAYTYWTVFELLVSDFSIDTLHFLFTLGTHIVCLVVDIHNKIQSINSVHVKPISYKPFKGMDVYHKFEWPTSVLKSKIVFIYLLSFI